MARSYLHTKLPDNVTMEQVSSALGRGPLLHSVFQASAQQKERLQPSWTETECK
ncbi:hypothetical protein JYU34_000303 [Plutella xylostella]|uniref:Uncharacterized protein n=1 Tax=Plutella xylostella TaxID=51655 RepID=A0ABQ7R7D2_PLUXY|nr:hypothetical protein JYU34_000303 [Plutella xylostella]